VEWEFCSKKQSAFRDSKPGNGPEGVWYRGRLKTIILATQEVEIRIGVRGQPGPKICKTQSQPMAGSSGACLSSQPLKEAQIGGFQSRQPVHNVRPYLKNKQHQVG
jgi:hypothetical protein